MFVLVYAIDNMFLSQIANGIEILLIRVFQCSYITFNQLREETKIVLPDHILPNDLMKDSTNRGCVQPHLLLESVEAKSTVKS